MPARYIWLFIPFLSFWLGVYVLKSPWACLLIYHGLLALPLILHRKSWRFSNLFRGFHAGWFCLFLAGCIGLYFTLVYIAKARGFGKILSTGAWQEMSHAGIGFAIYFIVVNPIFEECFWRDLVASKAKWPTIGDLTFGAFHSIILSPFLNVPYTVAFVIGLIVLAWLWRQIRWKTNGLTIPWLSHALGDAMFVAIFATLLRPFS